MSSRSVAQKSYLFSFFPNGIGLLVLGGIFLCVALIFQVIPLDPYTISVTINGVRQPPTMETVSRFRNLFLLAFGLAGLLVVIPGVLCILYTTTRRKTALRLKQEGVQITARATESVPSMLHTFKWWSLTWGIGISSCRGRSFAARRHRHLLRLHCRYKDSDGVTYEFKSDYLRRDPLKQLAKRQVTVYYDRNDPNCYFVDVDGSTKE